MNHFIAFSMHAHSLWADKSQLNFWRCPLPFSMSWERKKLSEANFVIASEICSTDSGSTRIAASPATSGMDDVLEVMTAVSALYASMMGIPKPSKREAYTKAMEAPVTNANSFAGK